ncbi:hypothetical protein M408DRAFT_100048 [Serendipita vermifera MAFF 305830]|uniref:Uncharacterized protein n=1 Tax=Serendipita vermifera MAFF 305830 TaxID=933852 RepID=A0A0C3BEX3_SERVB|nr:hypothetical protein M408DRAFT_100048 [Serendipita vermifera MAFF 305830]
MDLLRCFDSQSTPRSTCFVPHPNTPGDPQRFYQSGHVLVPWVMLARKLCSKGKNSLFTRIPPINSTDYPPPHDLILSFPLFFRHTPLSMSSSLVSSATCSLTQSADITDS